ncbi:hypothetical protein GCM10018953_26040 [Streptosporangium nondiastaticum]
MNVKWGDLPVNGEIVQSAVHLPTGSRRVPARPVNGPGRVSARRSPDRWNPPEAPPDPDTPEAGPSRPRVRRRPGRALCPATPGTAPGHPASPAATGDPRRDSSTYAATAANATALKA